MKLFLVYRNDSVDLDEYESAIVVAESPEDAINIRYDTYISIPTSSDQSTAGKICANA